MFSRHVINALLPLGSAWSPAVDSDYDRLLDGAAANSEAVRQAMDQLRSLRDPARTPILSDLEKEFAVTPVAHASDSERRQRLAATMFMRNTLPTDEVLQSALDAAGFNVLVHVNSPAVDPATFLLEAFDMMCGDFLPSGNNAECGEVEAMCARVGGELLVNGEFFEQSPNYSVLCDVWPNAFECGDPGVCAGQYDSVNLELVTYDVPTTAGYWPLIFFVGGPATRDPVTDEITDIEIAPVPIERRLEFRRIILKLKPMFSWAGLIVVYT